MGQVERLVVNGLKTMARLLGNPTFIWDNNGETFYCIPNSVKDSVTSDNKFFTEDGEFRMTVLLNQFTPNIYPDKNDYITYLGYNLLIKQVIKPAHGIYYVYVCQLPMIKG